MMCPKCNRRVFPFHRWLRNLDPYRLVCAQCSAKLKARKILYVWTLLHIPFGLALAAIAFAVHRNTAIQWPADWQWYIAGAIVILFGTAYVIPWMIFRDSYELYE